MGFVEGELVLFEELAEFVLEGFGAVEFALVLDAGADGIEVLLLGNCFWREGFEGAFGPERTGEKGGCIGTEELIGKTLGTDLEKGKLTLPVLNLLEVASESQREKLTKRIIDQEPLDLPVLVGIAEYEGAVDDALKTASQLVAEARGTLALLDDSESRSALEDITHFVDDLLKSCR
ncbi:polyprenyl synthetase family protein [Akkermansiaceae bacterium]|nr:polyprenyl synthetase family protein [Akkermansiaceae bacterium]MDB4313668.1 polyprenyl synthetase family protein [Akkermansiaceae bacterium]MDB4323475.1 polyprenyl synthetase family protein [Akkermansiaceae bacterium]MDB4333587.1 polyprenyl synthetase family protein [Akkermansiaceae bacterium]MDB9925389.1 polyprenyl synthetase family protein [bacterium]